jgi:hypothetical protein
MKHYCFYENNCSSYKIISYVTKYRNVQGRQERLDLHGTHQLRIYANDVNMLGENINTIKEDRGK